MADPTPSAASAQAPSFRAGALSHRKPTRFRYVPDAPARAEISSALDLLGIARLSFAGEIVPVGPQDFHLVAHLQADLTQACVVSLSPVPARIDEHVTRRFLAEWSAPDGDEVEMPEDDSAEPLPAVIDIADVLREALALALPLYPRAPGAQLGEAVFSAPGITPISDAELKPFAALASLAKAAAKDDK